MSDGTTRREFLKTVGSTVAVVVSALAALSGCAATGLMVYRIAPSGRRIVLRPGDYPELGLIGGAVELNVDQMPDPVVVLRVGESAYRVLSPVCTHLGCTVRKEASTFRCPCHGSTYALSGSVVRGPAEKPLASYRTDFLDGQLVIHL